MSTKPEPRSIADGLPDRPQGDQAAPAEVSSSAEGAKKRPIRVFHESAGAVVIIDGACLVLQRGDEWIFPKGHLESGEAPDQAAVREVREETGLDVRIICSLGATRYAFDTDGEDAHRKRVHWFLAERVGGSVRPESKFSQAVLLDRADVDRVVTHEADRTIAHKAFEALELEPLSPREWGAGLDADARSRATGDQQFPSVVEVVVEVSRGSRNKYEWDERHAVLRLDRVLSSAVYYNFNYAYVVDTRGEDGDHTDALLLVDEPIFPGCHVTARPVGGLRMSDESGDDFKVLCVAVGDPLYQHVRRLDQIEPHRLREIENFFATYKLLERKDVDVVGWLDADRAAEVLLADRRRFREERQQVQGSDSQVTGDWSG
jgi:inorganic pyrophosphatase